MQFKCRPENRMHEFVEMWMKQMLECILMPKSCQLDQVCCKIWESWKIHFNWQKFAQKKLNFWLLNTVCICQKTSKGSGGWVSQKVCKNLTFCKFPSDQSWSIFRRHHLAENWAAHNSHFKLKGKVSMPRVTPKSTYCKLLGTYATISLWSILAAHTE